MPDYFLAWSLRKYFYDDGRFLAIARSRSVSLCPPDTLRERDLAQWAKAQSRSVPSSVRLSTTSTLLSTSHAEVQRLIACEIDLEVVELRQQESYISATFFSSKELMLGDNQTEEYFCLYTLA